MHIGEKCGTLGKSCLPRRPIPVSIVYTTLPFSLYSVQAPLPTQPCLHHPPIPASITYPGPPPSSTVWPPFSCPALPSKLPLLLLQPYLPCLLSLSSITCPAIPFTSPAPDVLIHPALPPAPPQPQPISAPRR